MAVVGEADDLLQRLRAWTYRRQRLGRAAAGGEEALRAVVGVYSNHPTAPLALLARSQAFGPDDLGALERDRTAIRLSAMRGSIFLLPTATTPRIFAATRQPFKTFARLVTHAGLTPETYEHFKAHVRDTLREPLLPAELPGALGEAADPTGEARVVTGVRIMAYEGLVLRIGSNLRGNTLRFVATEGWLGRPLEELDPAEALGWLAGEYLRGYGPARVADFAWWAGATRTRAKAALATLDTVDLGGGLLLPAEQEEAFARVAPLDPEALDVLPKWDAYTMGLAPDGRQRFVADEHLGRAYSQGGGGTLHGDGFPLLLRGGRAVATWGHRFAGNRMQVTVTPFPNEALPATAYADAFAAAGALLGASAVTITEG